MARQVSRVILNEGGDDDHALGGIAEDFVAQGGDLGGGGFARDADGAFLGGVEEETVPVA